MSLVDVMYSSSIRKIKSYLKDVPDIRDYNLDTPLHLALIYKRYDVAIELLESVDNLVIDTVNLNDKRTPLHYAVENNYIDVVRLLISKCTNINAQDRDESTPLYISCENDYEDIIGILINAGADPNIPALNSDTCLHIAAQRQNNELIKLLLNTGANPNAKDIEGFIPLDYIESDNIGGIQLLSYNKSK